MPCSQHPAVLENLNSCSGCGKPYCPDCLVEIKGNRFCAPCKAEAVKDLQSGLGGIELPLASIGQRVGALIIDVLVQGAVWFLLFILLFAGLALSGAFKTGSGEPNGVLFVLLQLGIQVVAFGGHFLYEGLFLQLKGATPGKMAVGLRVVNAKGASLSPGEAWIRTIVKVMANICGLTYIFAFVREDRCALHDLAARTRVIRVN